VLDIGFRPLLEASPNATVVDKKGESGPSSSPPFSKPIRQA
jgi:hypothetical protein